MSDLTLSWPRAAQLSSDCQEAPVLRPHLPKTRMPCNQIVSSSRFGFTPTAAISVALCACNATGQSCTRCLATKKHVRRGHCIHIGMAGTARLSIAVLWAANAQLIDGTADGSSSASIVASPACTHHELCRNAATQCGLSTPVCIFCLS